MTRCQQISKTVKNCDGNMLLLVFTQYFHYLITIENSLVPEVSATKRLNFDYE